ncbi:MAG TPA: STAS domain-containing protein [Candidatus Binatia bacterium]|jgi:anti-sigma B factor antagonist|nr:STAS domain-containing protein [Candidatus Binatia bacterium]
MLDVSVQSLKRVDVITVSGRVDSSTAPELEETLEDRMGEGRYNLVLEMSDVNYLSSAGLRTLVSALRTCKKKGGDVRIANPSERVSEVMALAGLDTLFTMYDDVTVAVGSY